MNSHQLKQWIANGEAPSRIHIKNDNTDVMLWKFQPKTRYFQSETGMIDIAIQSSVNGKDTIEEVKKVAKSLARDGWAPDLQVREGDEFVTHVYFYPKGV